MQVNQLLRYSRACPFLGRSSASSLNALAQVGGSNGRVSALTVKAAECPMLGPQLARGYASVAGNREVEEIHKVSWSRTLGCAIRILVVD